MAKAKARQYLVAKFKNPRAVWAVILASLGLLTLGVIKAEGMETMNSSNYSVQMGNINITSGSKSSASYTITDTVGETTPGEFNSSGFTVLSGFQYIYALPQFSFRILDLNIELGTLQPNTFSSDSNTLEITTRSAGYTILAQSQHVLRSAGGATIPFTECDSSCSITTAQPWVNPANYGLGFSVAGTHAAADFVNGNYFRPFANQEDAETAQTIAAHGALVTDDTLNVTYKVAVPQTQAAGTYTTVIDYTAIPNY